ncbi:Stage 0 sporulation protein YaaT [hydrothermal vent metagenome]|uniref:Stage 0 sporulation protein YaaT n=1 Tax=hydrothermal vent metagenome TaxID=652676 RepID=A0A3B1D9V5_9ZZZZ
MSKAIQVQLGDFRAVNFYTLNEVDCQRGDYVVLDVDRGSEFGKVISDVDNICKKKIEKIKGKILRKATEGDLKQIEHNRIKSKEALSSCTRKITERKLDMRLVKSEYTFDSSKIVFFFTSDGRVDFRHLVKELARIFRVRIELKQIGVRDKAKIISGHGVCGRELCCASYMSHFHPLSIKMAKAQGLPLNPSRISGVCGRIKCCMAYEFDVYKYFSRNLPNVGDKYTVAEGQGKVVDVNILKRVVSVKLEDDKIIKTVIAQRGEN